MIGPLPSLTNRYKPVFTRLAVVKVSLRLASYRTVTILAPSSGRGTLISTSRPVLGRATSFGMVLIPELMTSLKLARVTSKLDRSKLADREARYFI